MSHLSDDDLVLHYYGEDDRAHRTHLDQCAGCRERLAELTATLQLVVDDVPARGDDYGADVWRRVRPKLNASLDTDLHRDGRDGHGVVETFDPRRARRERRGVVAWAGRRGRTWALAAAAAVVLMAGSFYAGRATRPATEPARTAAANPEVVAPVNDDMRRRVLLLTVADHLEKSDRVLTDIMNAPEGARLSAERRWAVDLVAANRLYRQDAIDADEGSLATVLDDLERALLDVVHQPADVEVRDLEPLRRRIDSAALLFKVRVMRTDLRGEL